MPKLFVLGDFNIDLVLYLDRLPQAGETLNANKFFQGPGGKGSNQAIATARLGADTTMFTAVGNDQYGQVAKDAWAENGVNTDHILAKDDYQTAMALINVDAEGNNTITVHQGANLKVTPAHLDAVSDVIAASDMVMCTLGVDPAAVQRAFEIARENGVTTMLNPAPAIPLPEDLLQVADIITPNESELGVLTGTTIDSDSIAEAARQLIRRDDQTVIVTLGAEGAQWVTAHDTDKIPTFTVEVVDTVGAGDAFNAGFAVALSEGNSLVDAIHLANAAAALSVQKIGAVDGMPTRAEVDAFLS